MGGTWNNGACTVPNNNPTGSWEQVNTFVMPIPDPSSVFRNLPGDGNSPGFKVEANGACCHAADEIVKGLEDTTGIKIPGLKDIFNTQSEFDKLIRKWEANKNAVVNTKLALAKCPVDIVRRLFGTEMPGAVE